MKNYLIEVHAANNLTYNGSVTLDHEGGSLSLESKNSKIIREVIKTKDIKDVDNFIAALVQKYIPDAKLISIQDGTEVRKVEVIQEKPKNPLKKVYVLTDASGETFETSLEVLQIHLGDKLINIKASDIAQREYFAPESGQYCKDPEINEILIKNKVCATALDYGIVKALYETRKKYKKPLKELLKENQLKVTLYSASRGSFVGVHSSGKELKQNEFLIES